MQLTNFRESEEENNVDLLTKYVTKSYLMDVYPYLTNYSRYKTRFDQLYSFGDNQYGQLGINTFQDRSTPTQVSLVDNYKYIFIEKIVSSKVTLISGRNYFDNPSKGKIYFCGDGSNPYMFDNYNATSQEFYPAKIFYPDPYSSENPEYGYIIDSCFSVSGGYNNFAFISGRGLLDGYIGSVPNKLIYDGIGSTNQKYGFYDNSMGGNPDTDIVNCAKVSCSLGQDVFRAVIDFNNALSLWGFNDNGELGNNSIESTSSPVQVCGGGDWIEVSTGNNHVAAIKSDGSLWLWGNNSFGQLGIGTTSSQSSPVQTICGGNDWRQIATGFDSTFAIKTDGTLWCWGDNYNGVLGDNTTVDRLSPVQTICRGNNWKTVSCSGFHAGAIRTDGTLWLWGDNTYGQLGVEDTINRSSPVQICIAGNDWMMLTCGLNTTFAVQSGEMNSEFFYNGGGSGGSG